MTKAEAVLIDDRFIGLAKLMDAHFHNMDDRLDRIEAQTLKTNGRVTELEKGALSHIIECPQAPKIRTLEDNQLTNKAIKKFLIVGISATAAVTGIVFTVFKLVFG